MKVKRLSRSLSIALAGALSVLVGRLAGHGLVEAALQVGGVALEGRVFQAVASSGQGAGAQANPAYRRLRRPNLNR